MSLLSSTGNAPMNPYSKIARVIACWLGLICCVLVFPMSSCSAAHEPKVVDVGIYLNDITTISLKEKKF